MVKKHSVPNGSSLGKSVRFLKKMKNLEKSLRSLSRLLEKSVRNFPFKIFKSRAKIYTESLRKFSIEDLGENSENL